MDKLRRAEYLHKIHEVKKELDAVGKANLAGLEWFLEQDKDYGIRDHEIDEIIDLVLLVNKVNEI